MSYVSIGRVGLGPIPGSVALASTPRRKAQKKKKPSQQAREDSERASAKADAARNNGNIDAAKAFDLESSQQKALSEQLQKEESLLDAATRQVTEFIDETTETVEDFFSDDEAGGEASAGSSDWKKWGLYGSIGVLGFLAWKKASRK